ncbi:MAG: zinc dependent phospholipase C family protein [Methylophilaceae bacterium]|jgi:hypothetical protein
MYGRRYLLLWLPPLLLQSADAHAWGLLTHVYFAQWLLWTLPLADPNLRRAVQKFPELVMAGACLPDLALISPAFRDTHRWDHIQALMRGARSDEESAVALGYASHLLVDVVAHNHFVPAHEAMWFDKTLLTHVTSEWAVDAHIADMVTTSPHRLLRDHCATLAPIVARRFRCTPQRAEKAIVRLANADRLLRTARLPHILYHTFQRIDRRVFEHFVYYVSQTQAVLEKIDIVLDGRLPSWEADPRHEPEMLCQLRHFSLVQLKERHPAPVTLFSPPTVGAVYTSRNEPLAISAPMAAPASTSLG